MGEEYLIVFGSIWLHITYTQTCNTEEKDITYIIDIGLGNIRKPENGILGYISITYNRLNGFVILNNILSLIRNEYIEMTFYSFSRGYMGRKYIFDYDSQSIFTIEICTLKINGGTIVVRIRIIFYRFPVPKDSRFGNEEEDFNLLKEQRSNVENNSSQRRAMRIIIRTKYLSRLRVTCLMLIPD